MDDVVADQSVCEVCAKPLEKRNDLLCADCSRAFTVVLELVRGHPELDLGDFDRIKDVFEWRMKKTGFRPVKTVGVKPKVREEEVLSAASLV